MYIKVFVTPGAKKEKFEILRSKKPEKDSIVAISVREPAAGNRANNRVRAIIAEREGKPLGAVRILTGHRSRVKIVSISG